MLRYWLFLLGLIGLLVLRLCFFTVDAAEYAYVTHLGRHVATFDGADDVEAGLHFGWPWPVRTVQRIDRRLQSFNLNPMELPTPDPDDKTIDKILTVEACVFWKVADREAVDRFVRRLGGADQARTILGERVTSQLGAAISRMHLDDLISTRKSTHELLSPGKVGPASLALLTFPQASLPVGAALAEVLVEREPLDLTRVDEKVEALRVRMLGDLKASFLKEYGVELVDIRLRRYNYPGAARKAIFDRIKSEREKKRKEYEAEGTTQAKEIATRTEEKVRRLMAEAKAQAEQIKAGADAEAMTIRNRAHASDPAFYEFLKKMEQYQAFLAEGRGTLFLSTRHPMFDLLFGPPRNGLEPAEKKSGKGDGK